MKRLYFVLFCALATACGQQPASTSGPLLTAVPMAQCAKDIDCKGDRICDKGVCQSPTVGRATEPLASGGEPTALVAAEPATGTPKFKDFPVPVYSGPVGTLDMSDEDARTYKTRLTEAMQDPPSFAGEYALMTMGCGSSGCINQLFVSRRTGKILKQSFGSSSAFGVVDEKGEDIRVGETIEGVKADSRLLVVHEITDPEDGKDPEAFARFYALEDGELKLIKSVSLPVPVAKPVSDQ